ncbi:MAG: C69 family dipeptidase [Desulfovibrio sp.]|nr:C69 family dipeptidase [Desulfovibrio sp.]
MPGASSCTTMIVTGEASADGSVMVAHSDDNDLGDQSIVYVPARDWPDGSLRPVYPSAVANGDIPRYKAFLVPRLVDGKRTPGYAHPGKAKTVPVGYIPQVKHTYAYLDGNYGIVNEHGLMFGECTDGSFVTNGPEEGKRIFYSAELSRVALERTRTAREAIRLMGELIETHGYYGTGETLPVADGREAWVMEMAPSPTGTGGLWVAQRVPDGHYFIAANEFRIRDIIPGNPDQMHGKDLHTIIEAAGWRNPPKDSGRPLDWLVSVSKGEYNHPYYSLRRVWRGFSLVAPSLNLSPWVSDGKTRDYPFSVQPDKKLTFEDIRRIYGDHYEGTDFDLTKGVAAGPFGSPVRYTGPADSSGDVGERKNLPGAWERPICMFYTGYTFISQLRPDLPPPLNIVSWIALNTPGESVFVPLAVGPPPPGYELGDTTTRREDSTWWRYNLVSEYANLKYNFMIKDIQERADAHEANSQALLTKLRQKLLPLAQKAPRDAAKRFRDALAKNAEAIWKDWGDLFTLLTRKYNQGYLNSPEKMAQSIGYGEDWLRHADYAKGPVKYEKP